MANPDRVAEWAMPAAKLTGCETAHDVVGLPEAFSLAFPFLVKDDLMHFFAASEAGSLQPERSVYDFSVFRRPERARDVMLMPQHAGRCLGDVLQGLRLLTLIQEADKQIMMIHAEEEEEEEEERRLAGRREGRKGGREGGRKQGREEDNDVDPGEDDEDDGDYDDDHDDDDHESTMLFLETRAKCGAARAPGVHDRGWGGGL